MSVTPPSRPWWMLIGPALAAIVGAFLLTALHAVDGPPPAQLELGLTGQEFLMMGVVAYLVAVAVAFPLGLLAGRRAPTAVALPAVVLMLVGALLIAFTGGAGVFVVGRVLCGLGAGVACGVTVALVLGLESRQGLAALLVTAAGVLAAVLGPVVNQGFSRLTSFRTTFLAAEPFVFLALLATAATGIALLVSSRRPATPYVSPRPPH